MWLLRIAEELSNVVPAIYCGFCESNRSYLMFPANRRGAI